ETVKFLDILRYHDILWVTSLLTHLDEIKDEEELRKTEKHLRDYRIRTTAMDEAERFYFSGLDHELYKMSEIKELAEHMLGLKMLPLSWRVAHPYVMVNQIATRLHEDNEHVDINIYGHLQGFDMNKAAKVHVFGVCEFPVAYVTRSTDYSRPLPTIIIMRSDDCPCLEIKGFKKWTYLRLEVRDIPISMYKKFDMKDPVFIGEEVVGNLQVYQLCRGTTTVGLKNKREVLLGADGRHMPILTAEEKRRNRANGILEAPLSKGVTKIYKIGKHIVATVAGCSGWIIPIISDLQKEVSLSRTGYIPLDCANSAKNFLNDENFKLPENISWKGVPEDFDIQKESCSIIFGGYSSIDDQSVPLTLYSADKQEVQEILVYHSHGSGSKYALEVLEKQAHIIKKGNKDTDYYADLILKAISESSKKDHNTGNMVQVVHLIKDCDMRVLRKKKAKRIPLYLLRKKIGKANYALRHTKRNYAHRKSKWFKLASHMP
ncbi:hypothetical protein C5167_024236, partial [Papaver somniferum]